MSKVPIFHWVLLWFMQLKIWDRNSLLSEFCVYYICIVAYLWNLVNFIFQWKTVSNTLDLLDVEMKGLRNNYMKGLKIYNMKGLRFIIWKNWEFIIWKDWEYLIFCLTENQGNLTVRTTSDNMLLDPTYSNKIIQYIIELNETLNKYIMTRKTMF